MTKILLVLLGMAWSGGTALGQSQPLPIFDAHLHYNRPDWEVYSPSQIMAILDRAGVPWALVSSTPDEGTMKLHRVAPKRIVACLRPYRSPRDRRDWFRNTEVQAYVEERLKSGAYKGIGEFHLDASEVDMPVVRRFAELAVEQRLILHAHVDAATAELLLKRYPKVRFLWAHAGMSASAAEVGRVLDLSSSLSVELSLRLDVARGGILDPDWQALFLRHPDRFLAGTDTWITERWEAVAETAQYTRRWLQQLPTEVAEQIAYRNAVRLFELTPPK